MQTFVYIQKSQAGGCGAHRPPFAEKADNEISSDADLIWKGCRRLFVTVLNALMTFQCLKFTHT